MTQTVIAIYKSREEARNAAEGLTHQGFNTDHVDVSQGEDYAEEIHEGESRISRFFINLFGNSNCNTKRYTKVARDKYIVTVCAHSKEEAESAAALLDDYGAIDVEEDYHKHFYGREYKDDNVDDGEKVDDDKDMNYYEADRDYDKRKEVADDRNQQYAFRDDEDFARDDKIFNTGKICYQDENLLSSDDNHDGGRDHCYCGDRDKAISAIEENKKVGKRETDTGGAGLRSRIIEKPTEENLRLREEYNHVNRSKVHSLQEKRN